MSRGPPCTLKVQAANRTLQFKREVSGLREPNKTATACEPEFRKNQLYLDEKFGNVLSQRKYEKCQKEKEAERKSRDATARHTRRPSERFGFSCLFRPSASQSQDLCHELQLCRGPRRPLDSNPRKTSTKASKAETLFDDELIRHLSKAAAPNFTKEPRPKQLIVQSLWERVHEGKIQQSL